MPEILKAGETIKKGSSFLDNVLSAETFNTLDTHAHTLDQVTTLMDKANVLLSNPVVRQLAKLATQIKPKEGGGPQLPTDGWSGPTMSEVVGGATQRPQQQAQVQPIAIQAPMPQGAEQELPEAAPSDVSALHDQVKGEIDKLSEDQLMDLLMKMSSDPEVVSQVEKAMNKGSDENEINEPESSK